MNILRLSLLALFVLGLGVQAKDKDKEKKQDNFKRWEKAIAAFEKQDKEKPPPKNGYLFVGSSSIRMWNLPESFPDMPAINRGFGGSQIADSIHFAPQLILKHEPKVVVLYAGDNDIASGKTPQRVADDFARFVEVVHKKLPKTKIVFVAIKPSTKRWNLADKIMKANALVEEQCKKNDRLVYLDVFTPMLDKEGKPRPELLLKDGLHMNKDGYAIWNKLVRPHLK